MTERAAAIGRWSARGAAVFCAAFAAFQVALALGAPFGDVAWGGQDRVLAAPFRWASAGAAAYLLAAGAAMLARAGDLRAPIGPRTLFGFNVFLALQLALNTAANLAGKTVGERIGMGAASAVGCLLCLASLLAPLRR